MARLAEAKTSDCVPPFCSFILWHVLSTQSVNSKRHCPPPPLTHEKGALRPENTPPPPLMKKTRCCFSSTFRVAGCWLLARPQAISDVFKELATISSGAVKVSGDGPKNCRDKSSDVQRRLRFGGLPFLGLHVKKWPTWRIIVICFRGLKHHPLDTVKARCATGRCREL